jgi:hypothetical protein
MPLQPHVIPELRVNSVPGRDNRGMSESFLNDLWINNRNTRNLQSQGRFRGKCTFFSDYIGYLAGF